MIPARLLRAIEEHRRTHPYVPPEPATGDYGEIATAEDVNGDPHVVLVGDRHTTSDGRDWHNVLVCDSTIEMATDLDLIVRRPGSYDLVVYAEEYSTVWADQLRDHIDQIDERAVNAIVNSNRTDGDTLAGFETGPLPLAGPSDPRWRHRERMLYDAVMPLRASVLPVLLGDL